MMSPSPCPYKYQRIIHGRVHLDLERPAAEIQRVAHRAVDLRDAAQRISVLHASTVFMRFSNLASCQQAAQVGRDFYLPCMRPSVMDTRIERDIGAVQGIE